MRALNCFLQESNSPSARSVDFLRGLVIKTFLTIKRWFSHQAPSFPLLKSCHHIQPGYSWKGLVPVSLKSFICFRAFEVLSLDLTRACKARICYPVIYFFLSLCFSFVFNMKMFLLCFFYLKFVFHSTEIREWLKINR